MLNEMKTMYLSIITFILTLLTMTVLHAEESITMPDRYYEAIKFCEFMAGKKTSIPKLSKMPKRDALIGNWKTADGIEFSLDQNGTVVGRKEFLKWTLDGNCIFIDRLNDNPMMIIVNTDSGFKVFNGDYWDWPSVTKLK